MRDLHFNVLVFMRKLNMQTISQFLVEFINSRRTSEAVAIWEPTVWEALGMLAFVMTIVMTVLD